jgi:hypothetical protein
MPDQTNAPANSALDASQLQQRLERARLSERNKSLQNNLKLPKSPFRKS